MKHCHLLVDARMLWMSGIGTYLRSILIRFPQNLRENTVAWCKHEDQHWFHTQGFKTIVWDQGIYSPIAAIFSRLFLPSADIFWCPHFNTPLIPIKARKRVVTIHDLYHLDQCWRLPLIHRLYSRLLIQQAAGNAHSIITVSNFSKDRLAQYFPSCTTKIHVIHNGVTSLGNGESIPNGLSLPKPYLLMVGNIKPHKNISKAIKAFLQFRTHKPEFSLVIVGNAQGLLNAEQMDSTQKLIQDGIVCTGHVTQDILEFYYKNCELFLFPSLYEGFGLPLLEAASFNKKICCSDIPPFREISQTHFSFFNPDSIDEICDSLLQAAESPDPQPGSFTTLLENFSWDLSAKKHIELLFKD